jgi:hypothetical protein
MVALHAADGHEGVTALGLSIGEEILELTSLIAAVCVGGVQVIALCVDVDTMRAVASEVRADAGKSVNGRVAKKEGSARDGGEGLR